MGEAYFNLKVKLEELGYNHNLPVDAIPLVECILADLLQTTRSLQQYMDMAQDAFKQRDSLMMKAEPYRCENAKLIQENSQLHRDMIALKEDSDKKNKENKRKIKSMCDELLRKDSLIAKLQHDLRELSLRGLCADTQSSRNKSRKKEHDATSKDCLCSENLKAVYSDDRDITELNKKNSALQEDVEKYKDEIDLLRKQVDHRVKEIIRLNMLLEGGRPQAATNKDCCKPDPKFQELMKKLLHLENTNEILKKEIDDALEKQHEAMLRALTLADKNKSLQEELKKVDDLALKVEQDCNKRLSDMANDVNIMQAKIDNLIHKNSELENELSKHSQCSQNHTYNYQESLSIVSKEKEMLQKEINDLIELNKSLQDKIQKLSQGTFDTCEKTPKDKSKCPTKDELQRLLEIERKKYEQHISSIQTKLTENLNSFNKHLAECQHKGFQLKNQSNSHSETAFVKHLHNKLCESEQRILMLKKENDDLKKNILCQTEGNKQNYKDIISQLNAENSELSKENIALSQQLSILKNSRKNLETNGHITKEIQRYKEEIESLMHEVQILKKDKQEYNIRCKEALELTEKLKRDLAYKQREIERLEEENASYKLTNRTGKASAEHLKEECSFLREQIKKMQSDVIKEKTLANQIKNIQLETERSNNEFQNELMCVQKQLHMAKNTIESLEKKCKDLQSEILSLKSDKANLIDNIRKIDQERDKLVIELDHKAETISVLEQKLKSQTYESSRLENEVSDLNRRINLNKVAEHKLTDSESQISFLNGEISRLQHKLDNALIENKHLQNSLADANGTLRLVKIEYEKSRSEVDGLKQQLQHYVAEIRRIEELLSQKEAERSDMLEQFASLSVEANILENTNHSLESESASKSIQLQSYISKIENLEAKLIDKENIIENQSTRITTLQYKVTSLENEIKLISEEKVILEQNVRYLKQMCNNLHSENVHGNAVADTDSELKLYENRIKSLASAKAQLEAEKEQLRENLMTTESLLINARREIVDLKLALQDATGETKSLYERISTLRREEAEFHEATLTREDLELPLMLEETIQEASNEENETSPTWSRRKRFSKFSHGSTL